MFDSFQGQRGPTTGAHGGPRVRHESQKCLTVSRANAGPTTGAHGGLRVRHESQKCLTVSKANGGQQQGPTGAHESGTRAKSV